MTKHRLLNLLNHTEPDSIVEGIYREEIYQYDLTYCNNCKKWFEAKELKDGLCEKCRKETKQC